MRVIRLLTVFLWVTGSVFAAPAEKAVVLTHADAVVFMTKHLGFFDRYIAADATIGECVGFLKKTGIGFGVVDVISGKEFSLKDCARTMGQLSLVFSGEATYQAGLVELPDGFSSWEELCLMNDVYYLKIYRAMVEMVQPGETIK